MQAKNIEPIFGAEFPTKVIPLIEQAQQSIKIIVFDWRWYPTDPGCACQQFNNAIIAAARRKVSVSVLTNCDDVIRVLSEQKIFCRKPISKRLLHSKIIIIDDKTLVIGSHNFTQNAFTSNFESSVILRDCDDLADFAKYFAAICR